MHKPAELQIPEPRYLETTDGRYKIVPITDLLVLFNASSYARAIHRLMADSWQVAPWAVRATSDDAERRRLIAQHYDQKNEKLISKTSAQIAEVGKFSLTIGLFDVTVGKLGSPESLMGYIRPSLEIAGNSLQRYMRRTKDANTVTPSLHNGPGLSTSLPVEDIPILFDALYKAGVESFSVADGEGSFQNTLDIQVALADTETIDLLTNRHYKRNTNGAEAHRVGSAFVTMQHPNLRQLQKNEH